MNKPHFVREFELYMTDPVILTRNGVDYHQRSDGTIYCDPIDQKGMVGGMAEMQRNSQHNPTRLARIQAINPNATVLDYGCGNGLLVKYLAANGIRATGYDRYNPQYNPTHIEAYDIVTMIEVIEHTCAPYSELDEIYQYLKPGGTLIIETSFVDWMDVEDPYIDPTIGHQTIFSHAGLNNLMISKGFEVGDHINRNVRVYRKLGKEKKEVKGITLILPTQGNPIALKRTLDSFKGICNEVILGDVMVFDSDRELIKTYTEYNMSVVKLPFNFIFENGFAATLNVLASYATNDFVLYANVGEMIDEGENILEKISYDYNLYYLNHRIEKHWWGRLYNKKELQWDGCIHEELIGAKHAYPEPLFMFKDSDKDMDNLFYAKVMNSIKELVYWNQYIKLVENPELIGVTHIGWVNYAKDGYGSLKERLLKKGKQLQAFKENDLNKFLKDVFTNPEFDQERQESSVFVNLQGMRKDIL